MTVKDMLKRAWYFLWEEDSLASWVVNVIIAFIVIKFLVYPGLGFMLGTRAPIVAVVSGSMEHEANFDGFWSDPICCNSFCGRSEEQGKYYENLGMTKEGFREFSFLNGFNKGDIMILYSPAKAKIGDVIVYLTQTRPDPIIHRIINIKDIDSTTPQKLFYTKGDHNCDVGEFEKGIPADHVIGRAVFRIPFLGWVKILAVSLLQMGK